ncbi:MAG: helix-turn-helix domain-containing protein [Deltaproteobacteria bacterium]|nr:helix-turn-helix domain-containing protein [Deltaproteobacteria bacterium]
MSIEDSIRDALERVAREVLAKHAVPADDPLQLLDSAKVAELLCVQEDTARAWLASGKLPGFKVEGHWRVRRAQLEHYVAAQAAGGTTAPDPAVVGADLALAMRGHRKAG